MARIVVIGAGIVGLAVAARLSSAGQRVVVVDKEQDVASHQTGRNSGVIHSGLYYAPGSLKSTMSIAGNRSMFRYAEEHGVQADRCGKLVVATDISQLGRLDALAARADANGVRARRISAEEAHEREPHVRAVGALFVHSTGIVDYRGISKALAQEVLNAGGELLLGERFMRARTRAGRVEIETDARTLVADALVNCGGLHSDRIARACGLEPEARIIPFRGEYFELVEHRRSLVRGLIYPVPDPAFPFLGVHLTRMIDGSIHAGPNAVLALAREGYDWKTIKIGDVASLATFPGMWRMAGSNMGVALDEVRRSLSRRRFAQSLAELVPEIAAEDLVRTSAGVRAQAMLPNGELVDDFLVHMADRQVHVLNSPSPAATCALEIAAHLEARVDQVLG